MRSARLSVAALLLLVAGCMLPRPIDTSAYSQRCEGPGPPPSGALLFLTTRLPDCRDPQANKMTWHRADRPMHGVWAANGPQFVAAGAWTRELEQQLATLKKTPILYIHGYNNDNGSALARAAAIRLAVGNDRTIVALTWPSYNSKSKYFWDEANAEWTVHEARALLGIFSRLKRKVVVVAHSMGNRVALDLVRSWPREHPGQALPIEQLIMAAPDVDRDWFVREFGSGMPLPITLYGSTHDQALSASWCSHGHARAGDLSSWVSGHDYASPYPYQGFAGISVVDTSAIAHGLIGHADFIESDEGGADLCRVVTNANTKPGREDVPGQGNLQRLVKDPAATDPCADFGRRAADYLAGNWPSKSDKVD
jgi:esterase/lipase superfamily enzyme